MSGVQQRFIDQQDDGIRLDKWFKRHYPDFGFGALQKAMRKGEVRLDGKRVKPADRVVKGQKVRVPPYKATDALTREKAPIRHMTDEDVVFMQNLVLYQDDDVIVLNKPPGIPTQGGTGQTRHIDGMLGALKFGSKDRPKLVHRLDKDTSGVLVLARSSKAAAHLTAQFRARDTEKIYWALVMGVPESHEGKIEMGMEKAPGAHGEKMINSRGGKSSATLFSVQERAAMSAAWVILKPLTGRTHQLRLHMAEIGCPIVGDGKYGGSEAFLGGLVSKKMHLHARSIAITHPSGKVLEVTAPLPRHMMDSWNTLEFDTDLAENPLAGLSR